MKAPRQKTKMAVTVKYRGELALITRIAAEQIEAANVKDVLRHIKTRYGASAAQQAKTMLIAVNGQSILLLGRFRTALQNADEVSFLPICSGG